MVKVEIYCEDCFRKKYNSIEKAREEGEKVWMFLDAPRWRCMKCGKVISKGFLIFKGVRE